MKTFADRGVPWHKIIAVDWDGVIQIFPHEDEPEPIEGAMEGIFNLLDAGWHIEFYSCGNHSDGRRKAMMDMLDEWSVEYLGNGFGFYDIFPTQINFPLEKPGSKIYVDDRGFKFEGWDSITPESMEGFRAWWQHKESTH